MRLAGLLLVLFMSACSISLEEGGNGGGLTLEISDYSTVVSTGESFTVVVEALRSQGIETSVEVPDGISVNEQLGNTYTALLVSVSPDAEPGLYALDVEVLSGAQTAAARLGFEVVNE